MVLAHEACDALERCLPRELLRGVEPAGVRSLPARAEVLQPGGRAALLRVRAGLLEARREDGARHLFGPGALAGELCWCGRGRVRHQVVTVEPSEIEEISRAAVLEHLRRQPQALLQFIEQVGDLLAELETELRLRGRDRVDQRLARLLATLARQRGVQLQPGVLAIVDRPTQAALASDLGVSREVVNRALRDLRAEGLLSFDRSGPVTVFMGPLRRWIDRDPCA